MAKSNAHNQLAVVKTDSLLAGDIACIEKNPKVKVPHFLEIVIDGFEDHDYSTLIYQHTPPKNCNFIVTYTAIRSWDFTPYMTDAEVWIRDRAGKRVGYGQFHLIGGGGLSLNKWASAESKMEKVFTELFPE